MLKMSADELGRRIGKNRATVFRYEKGEIENLPLDILEPIANALETTPAYLMGWEVAEQAAKKNKPVEGDGLSENMRALIEFAKSVPEDKVPMVLRVMKSVVEDD